MQDETVIGDLPAGQLDSRGAFVAAQAVEKPKSAPAASFLRQFARRRAFSMYRNNERIELQGGVAIVALAVGWGAWLVLMRLAVWGFQVSAQDCCSGLVSCGRWSPDMNLSILLLDECSTRGGGSTRNQGRAPSQTKTIVMSPKTNGNQKSRKL